MTISITYQEPEWIYEGYVEAYFEDATGIVTNRAPKQIHQNVLDIVEDVNGNLYPMVTSLEKLRTIYKGSETYSNTTNYGEWDVVNDGNGNIYISACDNNMGNSLYDRDYWIPLYSIVINDDEVNTSSTWSSSKLMEYLVNHAYDASQLQLDAGDANLKNYYNQIRIKRDTEANWLEYDPILARAELAVTDNGEGEVSTHSMMKIGDGVSKWSELEYVVSIDWITDYVTDYVNSATSGIVHTTGDETISGTKTFTEEIIGTIQKAKYADLAEYYETDGSCNQPGMLVKFGGDAELTLASEGQVNGIVSSNPGFIMNAEKEGHKNWVCITLAGRVPVLIEGTADKFDYIVLSDTPGIAKAVKEIPNSSVVIGRALENKSDEKRGLIYCATQLKLY